jgi:MATE family multidrug resistance protein
MPGVMLYVASGYFLEGIGRPRAGMIIMLAANVVNVFADGVFAVGWWGLVEPMGAIGAVITTSAIRWGIFVAILIVILTRPDRARYGVSGTSTPVRAIAGRMWKLGLPSAATGFLENGAYATLAQLAGLLGAASLAAHQVTINVLTLAYMGANGMAAATSVRVGFAVGRGDRAGMSLSGWTGIVLGTVLMGAIAALFLLAPTLIADLFLHTDAASLAIAERTIMAAGVFIVFAGAMACGMGALRGAGDMVAAMGCYALAYVAIGIPAAWTFAFRLNWGAPGLVYGLLAGVLAGLVLLMWRFRMIARREVRRA